MISSKTFLRFLQIYSNSIFPLFILLKLNKYIPLHNHNIDPSFEYIVNGINIVKLNYPGHFDHPGFTLHLLVGAVFFLVFQLRHLIYGTELIEIDFINSTELYINSILIFLILFQALSVVFATQQLRILTKSNFSFLYPTFLVLNLDYFQFIVAVRPEALIFSLTNVLLGLYFLYLNNPKNSNSNVILLGVAVILSLGIFTKITFLPFLIVLVLLKTNRDRLFGFSLFISFTLMLWFPIRNKLPYQWFINILQHGGRHGDKIGTRNLQMIYDDFVDLNINLAPLLVASITSLILLILFRLFKLINGSHLLDLVLRLSLILISFSILLFRQHLEYDLIPIISLSSLLVISIIVSVNKALLKVRFLFLSLLVLISLGLSINSSPVPNIFKSHSITTFANNDILSNSTLIRQSNIIIESYGSPTLFSAINFGNRYYGPAILDNFIDVKYANHIEFNKSNLHLFSSSGKIVTCSYLKSVSSTGFPAILITPNLNEFDDIMSARGFVFDYSDKNETYNSWSLYEISKVSCTR